MPSRRALLYMPGDDWKKITKLLTLGGGKRQIARIMLFTKA